MMLQFECGCGYVSIFAEDDPNKPRRCPTCQGVLLVRDVPNTAEQLPDPYGLADRRSLANAPALPSKGKLIEEEEEEATPYGIEGGNRLLSGSEGFVGRVRITSQQCLVRCHAIADQEPIALVSADNRVAFLDLLEKRRICSLSGHRGRVTCGAITPDGTIAITGDRDGEVLVWDVGRHEEIDAFQIHEHRVNSLGISPDGRYAVSAGEDRHVKLWRVKNGKSQVLKKSIWMSPPRAVAFAQDGRHVLAGGDKIVMWDFQTGEVVHRLDAIRGGVGSVTFSADGKQMAAAGAKESRVFRWERATATPDQMLAIAPSPERDVFEASLAIGAEHLISISSKVTAAAVQGRGLTGMETGVAILAFGVVGAVLIGAATRAATAKGEERGLFVEVWPIGSTMQARSYPIRLPPDGALSVHASSTQKRIIVGAVDGCVRVVAF